MDKKIILGIDASNIRLGGGVTHLVELLEGFKKAESSIEEIEIWGGSETLNKIPDYVWIHKNSPPVLDRGIVSRTLWQFFFLSHEVKKRGCNLLFIPGGSYVGSFAPVVSMCQNLLPFEVEQIMKCFPTVSFWKLGILRAVQSFTFRRSQGVIFLSQYSICQVTKVTGTLKALLAVIPHGLNPKFLQLSKSQKIDVSHSESNPFEVLYVSNIDFYKNHGNVLKAVKILKDIGYPVKITFIGPGSKSSKTNFRKQLESYDLNGEWTKYIGFVPYEKIHQYYQGADLGVFASSCETFGMILLEKMASGLPVACSNVSSMPEILRDGGVYFDPTSPQSIAFAIERYLLSSKLRSEKQFIANKLASDYSWTSCASQTFAFLERVALSYKP